METKVCKECGNVLPIEDFRKGRANGTEFIMSICKKCWHKHQRAGREKAKEMRESSKIDLVEGKTQKAK